MDTTQPEALRAQLSKAPGPLGLLLDYDGTLAPITPRPEEALLAPALRTVLLRLAGRSDAHVAIISGRGLDHLQALTGPLPGVALAVNGGLRIIDDAADWVHPEVSRKLPALGRVKTRLEEVVARFPGTIIEDKELSLSLHFRAVPAFKPALDEEVRDALAAQVDEVRLVRGKAVFELQPQVAWDKGKACDTLLNRWKVTSRCLFAGDDVIDEPAFEAVQRRGGLGVKVGDGQTAARWTLATPEELRALLESL